MLTRHGPEIEFSSIKLLDRVGEGNSSVVFEGSWSVKIRSINLHKNDNNNNNNNTGNNATIDNSNTDNINETQPTIIDRTNGAENTEKVEDNTSDEREKGADKEGKDKEKDKEKEKEKDKDKEKEKEREKEKEVDVNIRVVVKQLKNEVSFDKLVEEVSRLQYAHYFIYLFN